jgi:hypothetical protein
MHRFTPDLAYAPPTVGEARTAAWDDIDSPKGRDGQLRTPTPYQNVLLASFDRTRHDLLRGLQRALASDRTELDQLSASIRKLRASIGRLSGRIRHTEDAIRATPVPSVVGRMGAAPYAAALAVGAGAEYLLFRLLFAWLPVSDSEVKLIALALGVVVMGAVHVVAAHTVTIVRDRDRTVQERRERSVGIVAVGFALLAICGLIGTLAVVRGNALSALVHTNGGADVHYGPALWIGLGLLQLVATAAAWALALMHAQGIEWRDLRAELREEREALQAAERERDVAEARRAELQADSQSRHVLTEQDVDDALAHYRLVESEYLAILARELADPPEPITEWSLVPVHNPEPVVGPNVVPWPEDRADEVV